MSESNTARRACASPTPTVSGGASQLYGLMAEFAEHEQLLSAAKQALRRRLSPHGRYSPFPIEGLAEALGHH